MARVSLAVRMCLCGCVGLLAAAQEGGRPAHLKFDRYVLNVTGGCYDAGSGQNWGSFSRSISNVTEPAGDFSGRAATVVDCGHTTIAMERFELTAVSTDVKATILTDGTIRVPSVPLVTARYRMMFTRPTYEGTQMSQESASVFTSLNGGGGFCGQTDLAATANINQTPLEYEWTSCAQNIPQERSSTILAGSYLSANFTAVTRNQQGGGASFSVSGYAVFNVTEDDEPPPDPFEADTPTDSRFSDGYPTKCLRRSDGPHVVTVPISRVVGETGPDGGLTKHEELVKNGVISGEAVLRMPVFSRDFSDGTAPIEHKILVNGQEFPGSVVGGTTEEWTLQEVRIPIALLRFGTRRSGEAPAAADNRVELQIDNGSPEGIENSCAAVDWAQLEFKALAPVLLVHGNGQGDDGQGGKFWDGSVLGEGERLEMGAAFTQELKDQFIPYDNSISMTSGPTNDHGDYLGSAIPRLAREFGARHVHLVAHSKGGLDTRDFLARTVPANFGVLSLTTLSTPHHGSSGPDYQIDSVGASTLNSPDSTRTALAGMVPPNGGTASLRVSAVESFNAANVPMLPKSFTVDEETAPVVYQSISADANLDGSNTVFGNPTIQIGETRGIPGQGDHWDTTWATVMEQIYRLIGNVASTRAEIVEIPVGADGARTVRVKVVREVATAQFEENDFAVQRASARLEGVFAEIAAVKANHSTVASPETAKVVLDAIRKAQPMQWEEEQ